MSAPLFSIITVVRNAEKELSPTLDSIKAQFYSNYECIIIDGASDDDTVAVAQSCKIRNLKIISEPDSGIYGAMNKGIKLATGEYIYFLNSADYFVNKSVLQIINECISESMRPDILYGDVIGYTKNGQKKYLKQPDEVTKELLFKKTICHQSLFVKKVLFSKYGFFDETFRIAADYAWLSDVCIKHNVSFKYKNIPIVYYSLDGVSSVSTYSVEKYRVLRRNFGFIFILKNRYLRWFKKKIKKSIKNIIRAS